MSASAKRHADPTLPIPEGGPWGTGRAYEYCLALAANHHENYPVASWFMPKRLRPHVAALYAFARIADEFADAPEWEGRRAPMLDAWQEALRQCFLGEAEHPVFVALRGTVKEFALPITAFNDVIAAHRMDLSVRRYPTFAALLRYCEKSASALGRLMLGLVGDSEAEHLRAADDLATGVQLLGFWQQVGPDFARGRVYIPEEDLLRFGVSEADLRQRRATKQFKALMAFQVARTRAYFLRGQPLVDFAPPDTRSELQLIIEASRVALDVIERTSFDVFSSRIQLRSRDWLRAGVRMARFRVANMTQW